MNGAGAAAISIAKLLLKAGYKNITLCDRHGAIYEGRADGMNPVKNEMSKITNLEKKAGSLAETLAGADVFIGVSAPKMVTIEMVESMAKDAVIFACANPVPEIMPDVAKEAGAVVVGTGRSDFPNQVNNVLVFPGFFKGLLRVGATKVTQEMKIRAAEALASVITDEELNADYVLPDAFDERVADAIADAVSAEAVASGVCRPIHR